MLSFFWKFNNGTGLAKLKCFPFPMPRALDYERGASCRVGTISWTVIGQWSQKPHLHWWMVSFQQEQSEQQMLSVVPLWSNKWWILYLFISVYTNDSSRFRVKLFQRFMRISKFNVLTVCFCSHIKNNVIWFNASFCSMFYSQPSFKFNQAQTHV